MCVEDIHEVVKDKRQVYDLQAVCRNFGEIIVKPPKQNKIKTNV